MDGMVRGVGLRRDAGGDGVVGNRRRRWSEARRAAIVAESFAAGAKVSEVAARHGVQASLLSVWRRQAMGRGLAGGASETRRERAPSGTRIGFVPVAVRAEAGQTTGQSDDGLPVHSWHSLIADLATLARNTVTTALAPENRFTLLTRPTPIQHKALQLLDVAL